MGDGNFASRISCNWPEKQSSSRSQRVNPTNQMSKEEKNMLWSQTFVKNWVSSDFVEPKHQWEEGGGLGLMTSVQNKVIFFITLDVKFVNIYK
jgi:hypothetical protein